MLRVLQVGPRLGVAGGVSSVAADIDSWGKDGSELHIESLVSHDGRSIWAGLKQAIIAARFLCVARRRRYDVVHVHMSQRGSVVREGALSWVCRIRRWPVIVTIHGSSFDQFANNHRIMVKIGLSAASEILALTEPSVSLLHSMGLPARMVRNSVPVGWREDPPSKFDTFTCAGEVGTRKGHDVLLSAWAMAAMDDFRLEILGPLSSGFSVPKPSPRTVHFRGAVPRDVVLEQLRRSRAAVLLSRAEAMPMFLLEAMSVGCPVIATDLPGVRDLVGDAGILVKVGDAASASEAIQSLLDSDLADQLGTEAQARVRQEFSAEMMKREYLAAWRDHMQA